MEAIRSTCDCAAQGAKSVLPGEMLNNLRSCSSWVELNAQGPLVSEICSFSVVVLRLRTSTTFPSASVLQRNLDGVATRKSKSGGPGLN